MPQLEATLKLNRCPHCSIDNPNLVAVGQPFLTQSDNGSNPRKWMSYSCVRCGGVVTACSYTHSTDIIEMYPKSQTVSDILPLKVKTYLQQAIDSTFAPSGCVMLCASAVDAMLKDKGFLEGSLYTRINKASETGLMTKEMSTWAHQVRLESNDQRHADAQSEFPTVTEAKQSIEFAQTLAEFLFVLPSKVTRGIDATKSQQ